MQVKVVDIYEKLYRQHYCWVKVNSAKEFDDYLRSIISNLDAVLESHVDDECDGETVSLIVDGKEVIFFWFKKEDHTAIIHELLHAVFACMRSRGLTLTEASEESYCYLLSFLYSEVLKELVKAPKKKLTKGKSVV